MMRLSTVRLTFLLAILAEVLSIIGWAWPVWGNVAFIAVLALALILSLQDLRYGVAMMLAELIIGSHGYLLAFMTDGFSVSLRVGLFLVVLSVTIVRTFRDRSFPLYRSPLFWPLIALAACVVYAFFRGLAVGNGFGNVFFDANAFIYFGMAWPFWQALRQREDFLLLGKVALGALLASTAKVLFLTYFFSHKERFWYAAGDVYSWVRDTRIGELTEMTDLFFRIFFQSQIYSVLAWFIILALSLTLITGKSWRTYIRDRQWLAFFGLLTLLTSSILISLSRSNWLGMLVAFIVMALAIIWLLPKPTNRIAYIVSTSAVAGVASLLLITILVLFPFPPVSGSFSAGSLFSRRALTVNDEAGVSRWQLLPPLWAEITEHPLLGQGFGKNVTFITEDPRIKSRNGTGEYTTFVFEWGYHDLWLKLGLFGLAAYAWLLLNLLYRAWKWLSNQRGQELTLDTALILGSTMSLLAMLVTHTFSPYLNHPLGIGYVLLFAVWLERGKK
ncbi:MAG: O-antigen ligase family protein [Parcubacteria group bacterium]|nr:O-antigen ligase family protein [Parcubacteria group bacterium]